jgi:hypothetical protein
LLKKLLNFLGVIFQHPKKVYSRIFCLIKKSSFYFSCFVVSLQPNLKMYLYMKHLQVKFAVVLLSLCSLVACKENEQDKQLKVERVFKTNIKEVTGKICVSIKTKKEKDDEYFVDAIMADSSHIQAIIKGDLEGQLQIIETLNSVAARLIQENVRQVVTDLVIKPKDSVMYEGTATLLTGEVLQIMVHKENGWYPKNDKYTLGTIMKYQLKAVNNYKEVSIELEPITQYEYKASVKADDLPLSYLRVIHLGTEFKYDAMDKIHAAMPPVTAPTNPDKK